MSDKSNAHSSEQQHDGIERHEPLATKKAVLIIVIGVVLAVVLAVVGIVPRLRAEKRLSRNTDASAAPSVLVAKPTRGKTEQELVLPGALQAYMDSPVYARTSGYLRHWYADIGAHVQKGQLLAVIESPEVDQQLKQAQAELGTIQATARNAAIQAKRYQDLLQQNAVSTQDRDNFVTQQLSANTQVQSAQANVNRLQEMVAFERVYAPFTGTVTARDIDVGQLINAGATTTQRLFQVAQTGTLRVYVAVPQIDSRAARPGMHAQITLAEFPGKTFDGKIVRTAGAIDPTTRTLLIEVDVDNRKGTLLAGSYAEVHMQLNSSRASLLLPVSTMIFQSEGLQVAVVRDGKAHLKPITVAQNDGRDIEVATGLDPNDEVIQNPPDSLIEGEAVQVVQPGSQRRPANGGQGASK